MKALFYVIFVLWMIAKSLVAQHGCPDSCFTIRPCDIQSQTTEEQVYDVTLKWQNLDALSGKKLNCNVVNATYTVGPENDLVGWKEVRLASIDDFNQQAVDGTDLPSFNGFSYKMMDTSFLSEAFYKNIPADQRDLARWLVSDAVQMHGLALYVFDSLSYKEEFMPQFLNNYELKFENWVTFTSRYQKLKWTGIGKHNDELCAILKFESYFNPIHIDNEQITMKGRALYYGELWISLQDKQVEYAVMLEDAVFKLRSPLFPEEQLVDLQREIVFNKRNH
jgi:hypothetical protein